MNKEGSGEICDGEFDTDTCPDVSNTCSEAELDSQYQAGRQAYLGFDGFLGAGRGLFQIGHIDLVIEMTDIAR